MQVIIQFNQNDVFFSQETWASCETSFYNQSVDSVDVGYSAENEYYTPPIPKGLYYKQT